MSQRNMRMSSFKSPINSSPFNSRIKINVITIVSIVWNYNFLFQQGKTYTKNDIIELKRFYDQMDREGKGFITYEDYARNFKLMSNSQKHAKNVFETLDKAKKGQISFHQFVKVSIPNINEHQSRLVFSWMSQPNKYNENLYLYSQRPQGTNNQPKSSQDHSPASNLKFQQHPKE